MRRFFTSFLASLLVLLILVVAQSRAGSVRYTLTQLSTISTAAGVYATAHDINDYGVVVGSEARLNGTSVDWTVTRPLKWNGNTATLLPTIAGSGGEAYAINNNDVAVGISRTTTGGTNRAVVYRSTGATLIPLHPASNYSLAVDISDAGLAVGTDSALPFAFNTTTNSDVPLNRNNVYWTAVAVNEAGVIIANGGTISGANGRPARLSGSATPAFLYTGTNIGSAVDVNEAGVAVGQYNTGSIFAPAIFKNGSVQQISIATLSAGGATAINDRGLVAGWWRNTAGVTDTFLYDNGVVTSLATLVNGLPANMRLTPTAINNRGQIVGTTSLNGVFGAFRLDPVRTPGDTNADHVVNFTDLLTLAQHYGQSGNGTVFYETGDFNYDWSVGFDDLLMLSQHYASPASFEADWALAQTLVPEPAVAAGLLLLVGRRRR